MSPKCAVGRILIADMRKAAAEPLVGELEECMPRVVRYARRLCGARCDDAEDLTQIAVSEWLVKPIDGLPVFIQLRRIVRSRFLDLVKSCEHRNVPLDDAVLRNGAGSDDDRLSVRAMLERLPFDERYVLWSVYGQGYTVEEVACEMRVNARTVKRRLARARMRFAALYGDET